MKEVLFGVIGVIKANAKEVLLGSIGAIGAGIASLFGGWTLGLTILCALMALDYASGIIVAAVFKKSKKTPSGALSSKVGFIGIAKKGFIVIIVAAACLLDRLTQNNYIRDLVIIFYCGNEILSIFENAGLMDIKLPKAMVAAIDVLQKKGESQDVDKLQHSSGKTDN